MAKFQSKLAPVLRVKKQALDSAQAQLNAAKARQAAAEQALVQAREQIKTLSALRPQNPLQLQLAAEQAAMMRDRVAECAEKCELCRKEIVHYEHLYKLANMDYEKISALVDEDLAAAKKEFERKEALELDEIATMLMSRK